MLIIDGGYNAKFEDYGFNFEDSEEDRKSVV